MNALLQNQPNLEESILGFRKFKFVWIQSQSFSNDSWCWNSKNTQGSKSSSLVPLGHFSEKQKCLYNYGFGQVHLLISQKLMIIRWAMWLMSFLFDCHNSFHTFRQRVKPDNTVWMEDTTLKNLHICFPEVIHFKAVDYNHTSVFISPELRAQVSFSGHNLSVVRCRCCHNLFTFSSSPEPLNQFQTNFAQSILGWRGFKFSQIKGPALSQEEIITK